MTDSPPIVAIDRNADIHARLAAAKAALAAVGRTLSPDYERLDVAVLLPCFNEAATIGKVVEQFRAALPKARIYVYDNNSHDATAEVARAAGAIVRREPLQGKGHVVRRMFADVEADIYVMADGDSTYDAAAAPLLITRLLETGADMAVGARITQEKAAYRAGHRFGNQLLTGLVSWIFGDRFTDMLSGYRVFSRRFVKSFPALSSGFETETELTVHALELDMITAEVQTTYFSRPEGSQSKLDTVKDGARILGTIARLMRDERPLTFFGAISGTLFVASVVIAAPVLLEYVDTGLVPRFPTVFVCGTLATLSAVALVSGVILETVALGRREMKRLSYAQIESLTARMERMHETDRALDAARADRRPPAASVSAERSNSLRVNGN